MLLMLIAAYADASANIFDFLRYFSPRAVAMMLLLLLYDMLSYCYYLFDMPCCMLLTQYNTFRRCHAMPLPPMMPLIF